MAEICVFLAEIKEVIMKVNCRESNMCVLCKYWLGSEPEVNYITGLTKYTAEKGLCKIDESNSKHNPDDLCSQFEKQLSYM